jgi:hypothetical protein
MKVVGKVLRLTTPKQIGENKQQCIIIKTDEKYPQTLCIECWNKESDIKNLTPNCLIEIDVNVKGREWQKDENSEVKYFTSLNLWKFIVLKKGNSAESVKNQINEPGNPEDDLPF